MRELASEANEGANEEAQRSAAQSGRYSIEPRGDRTESRIPQPTAAAGSDAFSVNRLSDEELTWIEERTATTRRPDAKPSQLPPATVFDKSKASEEEPPTLSALRPYYREPTLERVQLQFEDKSLDPFHNPLALSSLQPPRKRRWPSVQTALTSVGALALIGVGYLAALANLAPERDATTTFAPASAPSPAQPDVALIVAQPTTPEPVALAEEQAAPEPVPAREEVLWSIPDRPVAAQPDSAPVQNPEPAPEAQPAALEPAQPQAVAQPPAAARRPRAHGLSRPAPVPAIGLAPLPSREQIQAGIEGMRGALQSCAGSVHGTTTARLTILGTGRVASATIEGAFAGTAQGSCMARALRTATFPRFASENLQVTYPFRL